MEQEKSSFLKWMAAIIATMIIMIALWLISSAIQIKIDTVSRPLDDGWSVKINGRITDKGVKLSETNFGQLNRLDTIDLIRPLGKDCADGQTIRFLVYLCSVTAYVGDELIYDYGQQEVASDVMVGSGYHFVELPDDCAGKTLQIHMVMNEKNAYTSMSAPMIAPTKDAHVGYATTLVFNIFICLFLFIIGIIFSLVGLFAMLYDRMYLRLFFIGLFATSMGLWTICTNKILQIFSMNYLINTNLEYISLFLAPIPFGVIVYLMHIEDKKRWRRIMIQVCTMSMIIFAIVAFALHYTNTVRFPKMLPLFHLVGGVALAGILISGFITTQILETSQKILTLGVFVLTVSIGLDLLRFNFQKYLFQNEYALMNSFLPTGALVFVVLLVVSYVVSIYNMVLTKAEQETLTQIAFQDVLTGISNRTKCELTYDKLLHSDDEYAIVNFDLNGLKFVNDKYGHQEGDRLIKMFAEALTQCFSHTGECFRIGGDEFLAVVNFKFFDGIEMTLRRMEKLCDEKAATLEYDCKFSYGIAFSKEEPYHDPHKVYSIADERMYEMKMKSKGSRRFAKATPNYGG